MTAAPTMPAIANDAQRGSHCVQRVVGLLARWRDESATIGERASNLRQWGMRDTAALNRQTKWRLEKCIADLERELAGKEPNDEADRLETAKPTVNEGA